MLFSFIFPAFGDCRSTPLNAEFLGRYRVLFWTILLRRYFGDGPAEFVDSHRVLFATILAGVDAKNPFQK